jgi:hypothetical protein
MAIDFPGQHRVRINGQYYPLYNFAVIPPYIPPAGVAPGVEEAMRAESPPQSPVSYYETVAFGCDLTLIVGQIYDHFSPENQQRRIKILTAEKQKYRGVFQ